MKFNQMRNLGEKKKHIPLPLKCDESMPRYKEINGKCIHGAGVCDKCMRGWRDAQKHK